MRIQKSNAQVQRKINRQGIQRIRNSQQGPVLIGPNWGVLEDEDGNLLAHNTTTGQTIVLGQTEPVEDE